MTHFRYKAIDQRGKVKKGIQEGNNIAEIAATLKQEGYLPFLIEEQKNKENLIFIFFGGQVKTKDLSIFCKKMYQYLIIGATVTNALELLEKETDNLMLRYAVKVVRMKMEKGETLAEGMKGYPKVFPFLLTQMVKLGEASGKLEMVFAYIAKQYEMEAGIKRLAYKTLFYPILMFFLTIGMFFLWSFLFLGIVQPNTMQFQTMLVCFHDVVKSGWWIFLFAILGIAGGVFLCKRLKPIKILIFGLFFSKVFQIIKTGEKNEQILDRIVEESERKIEKWIERTGLILKLVFLVVITFLVVFIIREC